MFSLKDICEVAIQIEKNGEKVYRNAQLTANNNELKELLGWMADEEARHAHWFENLSKKVNAPIQHPQIEELGQSLLKESVGNQTFSLSKEDLLDGKPLDHVIKQSIEFEKDTIIFYEMLKDFIEDNDILRELDFIIAEEQTHIKKLKMFNLC